LAANIRRELLLFIIGRTRRRLEIAMLGVGEVDDFNVFWLGTFFCFLGFSRGRRKRVDLKVDFIINFAVLLLLFEHSLL
jgi:hypothetical protein